MDEIVTEAAVDRVMASFDQLMPLPGQHASWCDVASHRRELADECLELADEINDIESIDERHPVHHAHDTRCHRAIAGEFLPEIHCCEDMPPTRARQPDWGVALEQTQRRRPLDGAPYVDDAVTVLTSGGEEVFRLLPGEALLLATALTRAAHLTTFGGAPWT